MLLDTYNNYLYSPEPEVANGWLSTASVAVIILVVVLGLIALAALVLIIIANCKLFKKAGEAWWKALIPLYNSWVETKITGLGWWWFLIFAIITAVFSYTEDGNFVVYMALLLTSFNYNYNLAKKFGKTNGFAVLNTLLPIVGLPILAFGSAKYDKDVKVDENGIFSIK